MVSNTTSFGQDWDGMVSGITGTTSADIIPGDPSEAASRGEHLTKLGEAFDRAGQGFRAVRTDGWHGQAAEAARSYLDQAPKKWFAAADAFTDAGAAMTEYQHALAAAKRKGAQAQKDLEAANQASEAARQQHNAQVEAYNAAIKQGGGQGPPPTPPGSFQDPAAEKRRQAKQDTVEAIAAVSQAGDRAAAALRQALKTAPAEPGWMTQLKETLVDNTQTMVRTHVNVLEGALGAVTGLIKTTRLINPLDPYNISHPGDYVSNVSTMAAGVVTAAANPWQTVKTVVNVDGWQNQPFKTLGSFIPDALASVVGGAGVASRVTRGLGTASKVGKTADKASDASKVGKTADKASDTSPPRPDPNQPPPGQPAHPPGTPTPPEPGTPTSVGQPHVGTPWDNQDLPPAPRPDQPDSGPNPFGEQQPWRPSDSAGMPSRNGEIDLHQPPAHSDPVNPHTARPERLDQPGPAQSATHPGPGPRPDGGFGPPPRDPTPSAPEPRPGTDSPQRVHPSERGMEPWERDSGGDGEPARPGRPSIGDKLSPTPEPEAPQHAPDSSPQPDSPGTPRSEVGSDYSGNSDFHASEQDHQAYREQLGHNPYEDRMIQETRALHPELDHVPDEELTAMRRYTGIHHQDINEALRSGDEAALQKHDTEIKNMTSGMNRLPDWKGSPEHPDVYRGIQIDSPEEMDKLLSRYEPGAVVKEEAFTSGDKTQAYPGNVEFVIRPEHAKDLEFANPHGVGHEVGWAPGNRFEVTGRVYNPETEKWTIHMDDHGR
ncbi:hypothetical protein FHX42_005229 [Saccharopolyspora lacisalsi]|uniref:Putative T7SS secretion signal domain-containing protein n=1 Tax=Halosaccharopolyspora lacisalsi TaxID=1000566 RepID=A0A839E0U7_9PSEU|nr:ADP-ribosyltransferase [Halosaccharopolyspora lacisalsi]MBA8827822.1 hypothetical protein [Halosaccharopolyspora lacisalsi]